MKSLLNGDGHPREGRICEECLSVRVEYIGRGWERCVRCGNEQRIYKGADPEEFNGGDQRK